jgi:DNA primase
MKDRIVIPIYDEQKDPVAYCGRAVTDQQTKEEGKYKLPPNFLKSAVVYNLHRQLQEPEFLIVVESYLSVFCLRQLGYPNTVAIMGSSLSEDQERLITQRLGPSGKLLLITDFHAFNQP